MVSQHDVTFGPASPSKAEYWLINKEILAFRTLIARVVSRTGVTCRIAFLPDRFHMLIGLDFRICGNQWCRVVPGEGYNHPVGRVGVKLAWQAH